MEKYYIVVNGEKKGPYALSQLRKMWDSGAITMDTKYASEGMEGWAEIGDLMVPPSKPATPQPVPIMPPLKSDEKEEVKGGFLADNWGVIMLLFIPIVWIAVMVYENPLSKCSLCNDKISTSLTCSGCGQRGRVPWCKDCLQHKVKKINLRCKHCDKVLNKNPIR